MASIVKRMIDASERLLFGATAEEAVQTRIKLIDQRIDAALDRLAARLEAADAADTADGVANDTDTAHRVE